VLAEKYRNPVILLSDATIAKMRESVELPGRTEVPNPADKPNALRGCGKDKEPHKVVTCGDGPIQWGEFNDRLQAKFKTIKENEVRYETYNMDDAEIILVAYGSMARVCQSAMNMARAEGLKVGMIRPISLWPFPAVAFEGIVGKKFLVCELSAGQMVEDVKLSVENKRDVSFFGKLGGTTPSPKVILEQIKKMG
jgi:2-oxoglutarate ferredoxin oxidoreductase subunit alpha